MLLRFLFVGVLSLAPVLAFAQAQPSGKFTPGHTFRATTQSGSPYSDGGGAAGSAIPGAGYLTEIGITNTGLPFCINDALTNAHGGYHSLCLGVNVPGGGQGGALIAYNSFGGAPNKPFQIEINGNYYAFPPTGNGNIAGPNASTINEPVVWANIGGTLVKDGLNASILHTGSFSVAGLTTLTGSLDLEPITPALTSSNPLYFPTYSTATGAREILALSGAVSDATGGFQDAFYFQLSDSDTTSYTNAHSDYAGRFAVFGPNSGSYQTGTKNYIGISVYALGATSAVPLSTGFPAGVSGITAQASQFGAGISSNEFYAGNPSAAGGGSGHSISMAGVQGIIDSSYAPADSTHTAYAFLASNAGAFLATAAYGASGTQQYLYFIYPGNVPVTVAAMAMPASASNYSGTIIDYGLFNGNPAGGSYTKWLGNVQGGTYQWIDSGLVVATLNPQGLMVTSQPGFNGIVAGNNSGNVAFAANGTWNIALDLTGSAIAFAGIRLGTTPNGSTILYDNNNYSLLSNGNEWKLVLGGAVQLDISPTFIRMNLPSACPAGGGLYSNFGVVTTC